MVAMMLLSALPVFMLVQGVARQTGQPHGFGIWVGLGYFVSWLLFGAIVYAVGRVFAVQAMRWRQVSEWAPALTGAAMVAAGMYQLTSWKVACLKHCRSPLFFVAEHWRPSPCGAFRTGFHHGNYCVACCWALMLIQCVLGIMSFPLMLAIATLIAAEKLLPRGETIATAAGVASVILGGGRMLGWL